MSDGINKIGKKSIVCLREPSLGPSFGMKGGAAGGGYAQVVPMEQINLHFTGDFHAITSAHNLLSALIDNHIYWGNKLKKKKNGHLILVTAITPTPAGEGKTTTSVGLNDGLNKIGKKSIVCLREPSLGPSFGMKGGAAGGGYAQVVPMEQINLHFTGDFHAITSAHNLLSAMIDNHIYWGNKLNIDEKKNSLEESNRYE